jgi:transcriptional regulator with XRE-family HTH domain
MKNQQHERREYVQGLMQRSPVSRNQIAAISGLSNPYIRDLEMGTIANVGREKLIALAIALDLDLSEIDHMLTVFDRARLSRDDIPDFLEASKRCRISAALHPVHDSYTFDLLLLSAELIAGPHVIVSTRPASCLRTEEHRWYSEKTLVEKHGIYAELVAEINRERRRRMMINLNNHPLEQYVCKKCLQDYIRDCEDPVEKNWRKHHIKNAVNMLKGFENYHFYLVNECASFIFVLKTPASAANESEKLVITVLPPHRIKIRASGLLAGFATDSQAVILNFKEELRFIKESVIEDYLDRGRLIDFLEGLSV